MYKRSIYMKKSIIKEKYLPILFALLFLLVSCNSGGGGGSTQNFTIGGDVVGLNNNTSVVLADNGGNLTTISQNRKFTFSKVIAKDSNYKITVATQPLGETCTVVDGSGYNIVSDVNNVQVICSEKTYTIGGFVEHLNSGSSVVLYNKTNDSSITVKQNGNSPTRFTFSAPVAYGSGYSVIVNSNPIGQVCAVTNHKNIIPVKSNIANILVTCSDKNYTIGGNIYGLLPNEQVTLLNNDDTPLKKNGSIISPIPFTFTVPSGSTYNITIPKSMQPVNEKCSVSGNSTLPVNSDIKNIVINCSKRLYSITVNVNGISNANSATIENNGSDTKTINNMSMQPSVSYTYTEVPYLSSYNIKAYVDGYTCTNASGVNLSSNVTVNINCTQHYFPIYAFNPINYDGNNPKGGMVFDLSNGYLYGTTYRGGASETSNNPGYGGIYRLDPNTGAESMVYSFLDGLDGAQPLGRLIIANDGNIYGTTSSGGNNDNGTIFKFNPNTNIESPIYAFNGGTDGSNPTSGVIQGSDGFLYGTAQNYGVHQSGTIYKISLSGQNFNVIYSFKGANDGVYPVSGLIEGKDGKLYGTTKYGSISNPGGESMYGTIYSINKDGTGYSILHSFNGSTDGAYPENDLIEYSPGVFYGITPYTGSIGNNGTGTGNGLIYEYNISSGYKVVYPFKNGGDGNNPSGDLLKGQDNKLYGVASYGGTYGYGTIYQFNPISLNETTLYSFGGVNLQPIDGDGTNPLGNLLQMSDGTIWGVTNMGNATYIMGSVFKYKID